MRYHGNAEKNFVPYRVDAPVSQAYLEENYEAISDRLKQDRIREGLSISGAAKASGVSERTLWKYENSRIKEDHMSIPVLQRIGRTLANDTNRYLSPYHRWVISNSAQDIGWLLAHHSYDNIDELARACKTTHRSLYLWRDGIGQPSYQTWSVFLSHLPALLPDENADN